MNKRLIQFLNAENITQAQFADTIKVARASISHIIAGRNRPGFDFIESTMLHYPELNIEWLITGKGRMYKSQNQESAAQELFSEPSHNEIFGTESQSTAQTGLSESVQQEDAAEAPMAETEEKVRRIARVVVFYDDNTFEELC